MATQIKITQLTDIGSANLAVTTLLPVVNMAGVPTTQKTTLGNLANVILSQSGGNYAAVGTANIAYSVANAAQPNITSVGTLTNVAVSGNATVNGNITSNGTAYVGNLSTTGLASITTLTVGATANLGAVANVTITGGSNGQVLTTNGSNVLSWTTVSSGNSSYGDSNVVTLLSAFGSNTITTTGNVSVGNIIGNGQALTNIAGANVSGFVPNANVANTAYAVAAANVTGLGNIATANFDGNASNVLHGDGSWSADTTTYGNSNVVTLMGAFGSNTITTTGNVSVGNISTNGTLTIGNATITEINPIVLGFTDDIYVAGDVLSTRLKSNSSYVALSAENGNGTSEWTFNDNGVLTLPQPPANSNSSTSINSIYSNTVSFIDFVSNNSANFTFGTTANHNIVLITGLHENDNRWVLGYDGNLTLAGGNSVIQSIANSSLDPTLPNVSTMTLTPDQNYNSQALVLDPTSPGHIHLRAYAFSNIDEPAANIFLGGEGTAFEVTSGPNNEVRVHSGGNTWTFDNAGNLTFPRDAVGNIDPILSIVGGATPTIVSTAASLTGPANLAIQSNYLNLSGFTGEKITFFPDDGLIATDYDMVLTTNVGGGNTYTWTLDATGNLNLPGNLVIAGNANVFGTNRALIQPANDLPLISLSSGANGAVSSVWVEDIGNVGTSNIAAVYANPTSGSGIVRIVVGQNGSNAGPNLWDFNANGTLTFPGTPRIDTSTNNFEVQAAEAINFEANTVVNIYTDTGNNAFQWQFGDDGNLTLPTGGQIIVSGGLVSSGASPAPTINGFSITNSVGISGNGNIAGNNISATGTLTATGKIGYASGSTVTQTTSRGNGVTINALAGTIITTSAAMVANEIDTFSVINSSVDTNSDIVLAQIVSPNLGTYNCIAGPAIIGGFDNGFYINIVNISGFTTSDEALTIRFMVIKAPNA